MSKYVGKIVTNQASAGYSVFFDGTGDYLTVPANAAFNFGTGDFTVEFWLYFQNLTGFQTIFDISYTTSPNLLFQASSGAMAVYMNGGSTVLAASAVSNGTWNHFALVRSGTTVTLYLNGVSVSSATYSGNVGNSTSIVYVGGSLGGSGFYLNGYLSNVRVVKGTALYTAAFTPPTQLFPITNTSLLTCQSPSIIDNSSNAFAITTNGNAAVSTFTPFVAYNPAPTTANPLVPAPGVWTLDEALQYTQQGVWPSPAANAIEDVFSTYLYTGTGAAQSINNGIALGNSAANNSSISLNAATPSYLTFSSQVNLSGNFCIQAWVYPTSLTGTRLLFSSTSDNNVQMPRIQENGGIYCYVNGTEITSGATASALQANVWTHLAMTRSGSTFRIFVNGVLYATATYSGTFNIGVLGVFFFSGSLFGTPYAFGGNISNAQIVSGSAVYTTDFTPPQNTLIGGSVLLGAGATPLADTSGTGKTVTQFGSPAASSSGPWVVGGNNGGLVWIKSRSAGFLSHVLTDTVRGNTKVVYSNLTAAQDTFTDGITSFNSNGFSLGVNSNFNESTYTFASWTFRKQAKFFDVVTYTGTGPGTSANEQQVSHNLGSKPGAIIIKRTDSTGDWWFFTDVIDGSNDFGYLNKTDAFGNSGNNVPTSTVFNVGGVLNTSGATYVAYLFAHNAGGFGPAGTDNVISCGSFTTDGSGNINSGSGVSLGYEPQFIIAKRTDSSTAGSWNMIDNIRGWLATPATTSKYLFANSAGAEGDFGAVFQPTATGFSGVMGGTSATYIYIAIRRGPMRPPTTSTSVFFPLTIAQAGSLNTSTVPFPPDLINTFSRNGTDRSSTFNLFQVLDRLRGLGVPSTNYVGGSSQLISSSTASENNTVNAAYVNLLADSQNITRGTGWGNSSYGDWINYFWRRAPGFFDVVCYTATGSTLTIPHNLTIAPELVIAKSRSNADSWGVYYTVNGANTNWLTLNSNNAQGTNNGPLANGAFMVVSATQLQIASTAFAASGNMVAYLFASVTGVSKVGSYTGNGSSQTINCGFTAGARFVMIKRTDSTGDWYVWDSARGIVAGNDPYFLLNSTAAEVTNTDFVDTYSLGFELSSTAPAALNASGGTYIFLAIA